MFLNSPIFVGVPYHESRFEPMRDHPAENSVLGIRDDTLESIGKPVAFGND